MKNIKQKFLENLNRSKAPWPLAVFCLVLMFSLITIFYTTPLRDNVERKFYDLRSRIKPATRDHQEVAVVEIDQQTLGEFVEPERRDLSYSQLKDFVVRLHQYDVKAIVVMLYPNVFDYTDNQTLKFSQDMASLENVYLGVLGIDTAKPSGREIPKRLIPMQDRLAGMEIFRERRHEFIRKLNFFAYRGTISQPLLPLFLSQELGGLTEKNPIDNFSDQYWLNYIDPNVLYRLSASTLYDNEMQNILRQQLSGRIVFLGYTVFRNRPINSNQIFVNTPWQTEGEDPQMGMPLLYINVMAFLNNFKNMWLKDSIIVVNLIQTIAVAIISASVWMLGISTAVVIFLFGWMGLIYLHALFFTYGNLIIPLADTALFSSIGMLGGSIWRLQVEGHLNIAKEAKAKSLRDLATQQAQFLLAFTKELFSLNQNLIQNVTLLQNETDKMATETKLISKVQASAEDFRDYLKGMEEFASLGDGQAKKLKRDIIFLRSLIERITTQFEYRCLEQDVSIQLDVPAEAKIYTDETLLEPIIFNLISNAVKYSPKNGVVRIWLEQGKDKRLKLKVKDQGPGIPETYHAQIFKKFYRVQDSAAHKVKGSGLGLYLSRYLADRLGVTLGVFSIPDEGATFSIGFD